jgi:hypothetical protein
MSISEKVILETKDGIKLLEDKLVYRDSKEYFIKDMKQATIRQGRLRAYSLHIDFNNGDGKEFYFRGTTSTRTFMISYLTKGRGWGVFSTMQRDLQTQILEWATNINTLIDAQV